MHRFRTRTWVIAAATIAIPVILLPHALPVVLAAYRPDTAFRVPPVADHRLVYLTIDDAPTEATPAILAILKRHKVHAVFFVMTDRIHNPEQIAEIRDAGHAIGNHMQSAKPASAFDQDDFEREFLAADQILRASGPVSLFRPPSDLGTRDEIKFARERGYVPVAGTAFPLDHWISNPRVIRMFIRYLVVDGAIIILHDGQQRGQTSAGVLDHLIPALRDAGFEFGLLTEALNGRRHAGALLMSPLHPGAGSRDAAHDVRSTPIRSS